MRDLEQLLGRQVRITNDANCFALSEATDGAGQGAAVVFGVFFLIAAWLLRSGRVRAGAIVAGVLCLFEVVSYPGWQKHGALDWTYDTAFGVVALAGLIGAITVLAGRLRRRAAA